MTVNTITTPAVDVHHHGAARWAMALIGVALLAYTAMRACTVSFSWDESYTFMNHVRKGVLYQDAFDKMGGNHHLLKVWSRR